MDSTTAMILTFVYITIGVLLVVCLRILAQEKLALSDYILFIIGWPFLVVALILWVFNNIRI